MNILFILPQIRRGGGQAIQALNLAEQLTRRGNKVVFLTFKTKETSNDIKKYLKKFKIFYYNVYLTNVIFLIAPLLVNTAKKIAEKYKIDIIQSFDPHLSNLIAVLLGNKMKIPVICRLGAKYRDFYNNKLLRGKFFTKFLYYTKIPSIILMLLEFYTIMKTKILIGNSFYILNALKQSFLLRFQKFNCKVIPNGVNLEKFSPKKELPKKISTDFEKKKIILFLGRIEDYKGIDILIRAFAIVNQKISDIHLILIGSYHYNYQFYKKLQENVKKLNLTRNISFLGEVSHNEIPFYLVLTKILVLPSYSPSKPIEEGFPNVILEAMACGRLIIASNIGGIPEIIHNQKNGLLFEPKNYLQLAKLILSIWMNPIKFEKLAENARRDVIKKYAIEIVVEKYMKLYNWSVHSGV
ncbi:MAG: glycosyltransferase family 4 protein [Promethearchaeota archaeon]